MEYILKNGIKLIYRHNSSNLTSISIGLEAGALCDGDKLGIAHATEHMIYKGTKSKSEQEINDKLSSIFGFQNAMTNYPYVIYYGTLLEEDFDRGVELFSDIIINPAFNDEGFTEEMNIIKQELKEWDSDIEQFAEDKLFYHVFKNRLKYPIIGTSKNLDSITMDDIKDFYNKNYVPSNMSIAVISSLPFEVVKNTIRKYFFNWSSIEKHKKLTENKIQLNDDVIYVEKEGLNISRVEIIFSLRHINEKEIEAFKIFNEYFGEGVNSVLYNKLRTESAAVYDVSTVISFEKGIKLYKINFTTSSKEKSQEALESILSIINNIHLSKDIFNESKINKLNKIRKLKKLLYEERSINMAKRISSEEVMKDNTNENIEEYNNINLIAEKVLKNYSAIIVY